MPKPSREKSVAFVFLAGSLCALLTSQLWPLRESTYAPLRHVEAESAASYTGFSRAGVYPTTPPFPFPFQCWASWIGGDTNTGSLITPWYEASQKFGLYVAGYPTHNGISVKAEVEFRDGTRKFLPLNLANAAELWQLRAVNLGSIEGAGRMRFLAVDNARDLQGWMGISEPVQYNPGLLSGGVALMRLVLIAILSGTFLLGPGLAWKQLRAGRLSLALLPLPGALLLTFWGCALWYLRFRGLPAFLYPTAYLLWASLAWIYLRGRHGVSMNRAEWRVFGILILVVTIACGKGLYSLGPVGELYENRVSRTTEVGDRSDSRVPFHVVQLVANGLALNSPESRSLFAPYLPTSRGPVAGLAASPVVLLSGATVPKEEMDHPWNPFDVQGFSAYRVFMVWLAASSLLAFFGVAEALCGSAEIALFWAAMVALTPFFVHEVYFTWPKLFATACVMASYYCALRRWFFAASFAIVLGYFVHPLALLSIPALGLGVFVLQTSDSLRGSQWAGAPLRAKVAAATNGAVRMLIPAGISGASFLAWNRLSAGEGQGSTFLTYIISADGKTGISIATWIMDRTVSVLNTVVPFFLYAFHRDSPRVNSIWGASPEIVRFGFSYWNTLPFALGIVLFFPFAIWTLRLARTYLAAFLVFVVFPFAGFAAYWGSSHVGLMREGLHPWYFTIFLFLAWGISKKPDLLPAISATLRKLQPYRFLELLFMLLAATVLSRLRLLGDAPLTDIASLLAMVLGAGWLALRGNGIARSCLPAFAADGTLEKARPKNAGVRYSGARPAKNAVRANRKPGRR